MKPAEAYCNFVRRVGSTRYANAEGFGILRQKATTTQAEEDWRKFGGF